MLVPKVRINNIPALVQIMAWCRWGNKPLSEPMMVSLLTHICVPRPWWVNQISGNEKFVCLYGSSNMAASVACPDRSDKLASTHWGQETQISISEWVIIGSGNGLSPVRCQAITWTNDDIISIVPSKTYFSEISIKIYKFSIKKIHSNMLSANCWPFFSSLHLLLSIWAQMCI